MQLTQVYLPIVQNFVLTEADTEYAIDLGINTKKFCIQSRNGNVLKLSYSVGESGTNYFTIPANAVYYEDLIGGPIRIYIQSSIADTIIELITYIHVD